jgi:hypothetical protein
LRRDVAGNVFFADQGKLRCARVALRKKRRSKLRLFS